jgi:hypothetical protein
LKQGRLKFIAEAYLIVDLEVVPKFRMSLLEFREVFDKSPDFNGPSGIAGRTSQFVSLAWP